MLTQIHLFRSGDLTWNSDLLHATPLCHPHVTLRLSSGLVLMSASFWKLEMQNGWGLFDLTRQPAGRRFVGSTTTGTPNGVLPEGFVPSNFICPRNSILIQPRVGPPEVSNHSSLFQPIDWILWKKLVVNRDLRIYTKFPLLYTHGNLLEVIQHPRSRFSHPLVITQWVSLVPSNVAFSIIFFLKNYPLFRLNSQTLWLVYFSILRCLNWGYFFTEVIRWPSLFFFHSQRPELPDKLC